MVRLSERLPEGLVVHLEGEVLLPTRLIERRLFLAEGEVDTKTFLSPPERRLIEFQLRLFERKLPRLAQGVQLETLLLHRRIERFPGFGEVRSSLCEFRLQALVLLGPALLTGTKKLVAFLSRLLQSEFGLPLLLVGNTSTLVDLLGAPSILGR